MFGPSAGEVLMMIIAIIASLLGVIFWIRSKTKFKIAQLKHHSDIRTSNLRYDVFLSYSASDKIIAEKLTQQIKNANLEVFFAEKQLEAGTKFGEKIRQALIDSQEVWVLATPISIKSTWVATEWGTAWALEKRIIPILHNISSSELPDRLRSVQTVDLAQINSQITKAYSRKTTPNTEKEKKILSLAFLCLSFGILGVHRFYVGRRKSGLLQLIVTILLFIGNTPLIPIWPMIDLIFILFGRFTDGNRRAIREWI